MLTRRMKSSIPSTSSVSARRPRHPRIYTRRAITFNDTDISRTTSSVDNPGATVMAYYGGDVPEDAAMALFACCGDGGDELADAGITFSERSLMLERVVRYWNF
ncbi:hypothetical protein PM082_015134 [Marasmius tenuissimus]|nr:hypothetical protein PM082_015134 [Marasmius tenuissimus]